MTLNSEYQGEYYEFMRSSLSDAVPLCPAHACIDDPTQSWVFWLCILFGFGFFLLLIVVVFLLSAVTCSCVSTEADKKGRKVSGGGSGSLSGSGRVNGGGGGGPGVIEEFDPYARSWHGSQYGSRFVPSRVAGSPSFHFLNAAIFQISSELDKRKVGQRLQFGRTLCHKLL